MALKLLIGWMSERASGL